MALLWTDSFDYYTNPTKIYDVSLNGGTTISASAARNGSQGMVIQGGGVVNEQKLVTPGQQIFMGSAANVQVAAQVPLWGVFDGGTTQVNLFINASGQLIFIRGGSVTIATSTLLVSPLNAWHFIEARIVISPTAGIVEAKVDGTFYIQQSNLNTSQSGSSQFTSLFIGAAPQGGYGGTLWIDDFYACDGTGNQCNSYLGDVVIVAQVPVANGGQNDFTIGGSTLNPANWQQVNEIPADDNTTYVYSSLVNAKELYSYPALLQTSGVVYGVMLKPRMSRDDAGLKNFRAIMNSQGVQQDNGSDTVALQGFSNYAFPFYVDPATGVAYSLAGINLAQSGIVITG